MTPVAVALVLMLAPPIQRAPVETALARVIAASLSDEQYDWALQWSPFGVRMGREVRWHLFEPGADDRAGLPGGLYRRVGWVSQDGMTGSVAACGDATQVHAMAITVTDLWLGEGDLIAELAALGVTATEVSRREAVIPQGADDHDRSLRRGTPAHVSWTLEKAGHGDAILSADHLCTPPGTRHATYCQARFTVQFRPDEPATTGCALPGRFG